MSVAINITNINRLTFRLARLLFKLWSFVSFQESILQV